MVSSLKGESSTYLINHVSNYEPIFKTILSDPLKERKISIELIVDTGFQGGVLIPLKTYVELNLNLYEEYRTLARSAVGKSFELRTSKAFIKVGDKELLCSAYTTLNVRRSLVGREVLSKVGLLYDPPSRISFIRNSLFAK